MPGLNYNIDELEQITLTNTDSPQQSDMLRNVLTTGLELQVSADVSIAGGATSGTLLSETLHNLLEWVMVERDGDEFVERIPGRSLAAFQRYIEARPPRFTTLANGDIQANTILQATYLIPFALPLIINPFETVGYYRPVGESFKVWVKRANTVNVGSFLTGSDRTLTLNGLTVRIFQHFAKVPSTYRPSLLTRYRMQDSDAVAGSVSNFRVNLQTNPNERLAFTLQHHLRNGVGVNDLVNQVTLEHDKGKIYDVVPPATLRRREERFYPGIDASAGTTETGTHQGRPTGYLGYNFLTDHVGSRWGMGRLRQAVNAERSQGYRFNLDVTSGAGTQIIRHMHVLLESVPGWTKL